MSKSPAFQFYAADYLADEAVNLMSLEAEGAYTRLLAYCWREGSIPASEAQLSRLCKGAAAEVITEVLGCFYADPSQPGRLLHKRLESERAKQEEFRARQAAKGQKGGRPKKPDESPEKPPALSGLSETKAGEKPAESSSSSTSSSSTSDEVPPASAPSLTVSKKTWAEEKAAENDLPIYTPDDFPGLANPRTFQAICVDLRLPIDLDHEAYRATIQEKMRAKNFRALSDTYRSWISEFFLLERRKGELLRVTAGLPTKPTPKHELPAKGQERQGQVIAIRGEADQYVNKQLAAAWQQQYPNAHIHIISPRTP